MVDFETKKVSMIESVKIISNTNNPQYDPRNILKKIEVVLMKRLYSNILYIKMLGFFYLFVGVFVRID